MQAGKNVRLPEENALFLCLEGEMQTKKMRGKKRMLFRVRFFNSSSSSTLLLTVLLGIAGFACDKYPANPVEPEIFESVIHIDHLATEYVEARHHIDGLVTDRANLLTFSVSVDNLTADALEVHGKVIIGGPPYQKEHAFTFRTDSISYNLDNCPILQEIILEISSGRSYTFSRSILPPNEYSPFSGEQGKVDSIVLNTVYSIAADGSKDTIPFVF